MIFEDYLALRLAVSEEVGNRSITDVMPRLVKQAEIMMQRDLRHRKMIGTATVTMASGVGDLPIDYMEMLQIKNGNCELRQVSIDLLNREYSNLYVYAVNGSKLYINGADRDQEIKYYQSLPTIADAVDGSNWLLLEAPYLYLYAATCQAAKFLKDAEKEAEARGRYEQELSELEMSNNRAQWADSRVRLQGIRP